MRPINFFTFLLFTLITVGSILGGLPYFICPVLFVFIFIPLFDYFLGEQKSNPSLNQELSWKNSRIWSLAIYFYIATHFIVLFLAMQTTKDIEFLKIVFLGIVVGLYTGGLGITVAHELCHKAENVHRFFANVLLSTVWYCHFSVEHVRGHHLAVATPDDPASARKNESVYNFLPRTLKGSFFHAIQIDKSAVFFGLFYSAILTLIVFFIFSWQGVLLFLVQSAVAIVLLELVNYVEHYGLSRSKLQNGRYEKVRPEHSWNSSHLFSSAILFNLQRHSDHHAAANRPYTILRHLDIAPQLPCGYPFMILLALFPKLWFRLMNKLLAQHLNTQDRNAN